MLEIRHAYAEAAYRFLARHGYYKTLPVFVSDMRPDRLFEVDCVRPYCFLFINEQGTVKAVEWHENELPPETLYQLRVYGWSEPKRPESGKPPVRTLPRYVYLSKCAKKIYRVAVPLPGLSQRHVGLFSEIEAAIAARDAFCKEHNIEIKEAS